MLKLFLPNDYVKSIFEIEPNKLKEHGIKGIIIDLDNTLVAWNVENATPEVIEWFERMDEHNIKITIISNNNGDRVRIFSEPIGREYVSSARKPLRRSFIKGVNKMGLKKEEVAVIGDQLLTDVFGGNRTGLHTILVAPIVETDAKITTFNRKIERMILNRLRKKGKITWEE